MIDMNMVINHKGNIVFCFLPKPNSLMLPCLSYIKFGLTTIIIENNNMYNIIANKVILFLM